MSLLTMYSWIRSGTTTAYQETEVKRTEVTAVVINIYKSRDRNSNVLITPFPTLFHTHFLEPHLPHSEAHTCTHTCAQVRILSTQACLLVVTQYLRALAQDAPPPDSPHTFTVIFTHLQGLSSRSLLCPSPFHISVSFPSLNNSSSWSFHITHASPELYPVSYEAGLFHPIFPTRLQIPRGFPSVAPPQPSPAHSECSITSGPSEIRETSPVQVLLTCTALDRPAVDLCFCPHLMGMDRTKGQLYSTL